MKYIIWLAFLSSITSILFGLILDVNYTEKLIGFGTCGLFLAWIPLFIYHNWKGKDPKDYMLTSEGIEAMREAQENSKES